MGLIIHAYKLGRWAYFLQTGNLVSKRSIYYEIEKVKLPRKFYLRRVSDNKINAVIQRNIEKAQWYRY